MCVTVRLLEAALRWAVSGAPSVSGGPRYRCSVCGLPYQHLSSLNKHRKVHTGDTECPFCGRIMGSRHNLRGSTVDARRGTFRCEFCGRIYNHLVSLGQHMKLHKGDTTCHVCGKVLSRTTQLRIHLRQIHGL
ncbi:Krueppel 1 [Amphibalanus amphitrite]|uniref:Krueppel 1 n=1 Tax=Amphibalanus amphitrite TaxID=1232801 RepID=A0A6A4VIU9_AMPAM|nr:Krueppel 1 [Amphibalanus amphitrite]